MTPPAATSPDDRTWGRLGERMAAFADPVSAIREDQAARWAGGTAAPVEEYLRRFPALGDEDALVLIVAEVEHRRRVGETPAVAEYQTRFPALAAALAVQFLLLDSLAAGPLTTPTVVGEATVRRPADAPFPAAPPGYEILGRLGSGGMGVVYRARQVALGREVTLKTINRAGLGREAVARFWAEAEVMAAVRHPHVVQVFELGEHDGAPFIAMEHAAGGSFDALLAARAPLPAAEATAFLEKVARGVAAAHDLGIVHRDLKPANVLLAGPADAPEPRVADFGLAKRRAVDLTATQAMMGTPLYMAPEQAAGRAKFVGPAADVWALGVILYETLTGRRPFEAAAVQDLLSRISTTEPLAIGRRVRGVPRDLETIVAKCLAKEPAHRYPTAAELADDLGRFQRGEPIAARPPSRAYRFAKFARRNRWAVAATALVILALTGGVIGTSIGMVGARDAEKVARAAEKQAREAEQQARRHLLASQVAAAKLALQRGDGRAALRLLDAATAAADPADLPGLALDRVRALCVTHDIPRAAAEARALAGRTDLGDLAGRVLLRHAALEMDTNRVPTEDGLKLIRRAVELGLPPAEEAYARAFLAETTPDAIDGFRRAVAADPYDARALGSLALLLTLTGHAAEARDRLTAGEALFPDDPTFPATRAMLVALEGDSAGADEHVRRIAARYGEEIAVPTRDAIGLCRQLAAVGRAMVEALYGKPTQNPAFLALGLASRLNRAGAADDAGPRLYLPLPPVLGTVAKRAAPEVLAALVSGADPRPKVAALERLARVHPEGWLYLTCGALLAVRDDLGDVAEAERAFLRAADLPSIFTTPRDALYGALFAESQLLTEGAGWDRLGAACRAVGTLRRLLAAGLVNAEQARLAAIVAINLNQPDLAHRAVAEWERLDPASPALRGQKAKLALVTGAYGRAIELADGLAGEAGLERLRSEVREAAAAGLRRDAARLGDAPPGRP